MLQIVSFMIFYSWLFVMAFFLWRIWREAVKRARILEQALADIALKNAESNKALAQKLSEQKLL